jgi:hypothetical protein
LEKREKSDSKTEYSNELEVAGFRARNREGFQILLSSVLLRNERWFKAPLLISKCWFHRKMRELFLLKFQHQNSEGKGGLRERYG